MAGFSDGDDDDVIGGINVTPFVDITLVLLVIFMVTTTFVTQSQIKIDLPKAASGQNEVSPTMVFQVSADGRYAINGEWTTMEDIARRIRREVASDPKVRAVISADKEVGHGKVVDLMDTLKLGGVQAIAFNIVRKEKPAEP